MYNGKYDRFGALRTGVYRCGCGCDYYLSHYANGVEIGTITHTDISAFNGIDDDWEVNDGLHDNWEVNANKIVTIDKANIKIKRFGIFRYFIT